MEFDRRTLFGAAALPLLPATLGKASLSGNWDEIAGQYDVTREIIQLEHGNWGMMARPVQQAYLANVERVNRDTSYYARRTMNDDLQEVTEKVADFFGVAFEEITLTRNATEALKALILQYNRLKPGDAVLYSDLDYDSAQACMDSLGERRGVRVAKIALPEPATHDNLVAAYAEAFAANPDVRMALLTHVSHRTGLVLPVAEIAELARARGIDCIVDAAHSVGQLDFALPDLKVDFIAMNLHKWIGAPLGVGALYIRKERIAAIDPDPAEPPDSTGIYSRAHTGTPDYAAQLTVPTALAFQSAIGSTRREGRLKSLRDRWVTPLHELPQVQILTPDDPRCYGAITSFRLRGQVTREQNLALAAKLLERHRIFTVHRTGLASGACIRVTPALATREREVDRLAEAIREIASTT
ncbi:aminotransferase class V-fold PLP-dependent enzyme [Qipengyuania soli]|uniref:Aminotransferase class V-fold PLP-dependent enzyme n=1 Tax=Qipengyuania soli TaxID=2782568 RepID=A0A7S8F5A0_9SPHN|nr:aminotransferase class V-fold PLP-dependent enzyme [Qipengyuania soli]QPC99368.1 aminotransferase class V-fold PLP-dependent enzyme [Qipengyuania soli]